MKKIIAAIDGLKYSESTVRYAIYLAKQAKSHLVGVFLEDFTYHGYKIYELIGEEGVSIEKKRVFEKKDKESRELAVVKFKELCEEENVNHSVHYDRNIAIQQLLHESIYADLVIIDGTETLTHHEEKKPTRFIRDLLSQVQCPVLIVPKQFTPVEKVVLLYDGEPVSVMAIRAFSYVFSEIDWKEVEVFSVKSAKQTLHVPDNRLMKEFMKRHFPDATYTVIKGEPEIEIVSYLKKHSKKTMVVLGAYSRGMVSRWFRASMADILMEELDFPLFITHNK